MLPAVTINVPQNQGTLLRAAAASSSPTSTSAGGPRKINNLETEADPTHLPLYLTNNVLLLQRQRPDQVLRHRLPRHQGDRRRRRQRQQQGQRRRCRRSRGRRYVQPGFYARPNGGTDWALQDIHALSHEIAEWADDPFVNNAVEPWLTPTAPQYGCTSVLETGDPVVGIGFAMGTNTYLPGPEPERHAERRRLLPPGGRGVAAVVHATAVRTRTGSDAEPVRRRGRYTLMGDLNPFPGFRQPATGC